MIKRRSASFVLVLLVLFIVGGFTLLAFRKENQVDWLAFVAMAVITFFDLIFYNLMAAGFPSMDRFILLPAEFLWTLGLLILYRLDMMYAIKQFVFLMAGALALLLVMHIIRRSNNFGKYNWLLMALTLLLLILPFVFGRTIGGAKNWIRLGPISLQPSEFAKLLFIVVSAYFLTTREQLRQFIPYLIFTALCVIILVLERDLGAALLIGATFLVMFFAATGRVWFTLAGVGILGVGAVASYHLFSHVRTRVEIWRDPWSFYNDKGYQVVQGLIALASGGLLGTGLMRGMPEVVPARHTDYIFSVIGEEMGLIVAVFVIAFYLLFIIRGILIATHARSNFDALLVFGCTALLSLQSFIIIGGVIKLIPLTGITVPFVSYGGSSILSSMMNLGVILGISVKNGRQEMRELRKMGGEIL